MEALLKMVEEMVCPNQLSEMVIGQTKEIIVSLINMKTQKQEDKAEEGDDDTDEGIEEDASSESDKVEEILQGCANLSLRGEGWFFAQSERSPSSDEEEYQEDFRVLSSLNPVIVNVESDSTYPDVDSDTSIINIE